MYLSTNEVVVHFVTSKAFKSSSMIRLWNDKIEFTPLGKQYLLFVSTFNMPISFYNQIMRKFTTTHDKLLRPHSMTYNPWHNFESLDHFITSKCTFKSMYEHLVSYITFFWHLGIHLVQNYRPFNRCFKSIHISSKSS